MTRAIAAGSARGGRRTLLERFVTIVGWSFWMVVFLLIYRVRRRGLEHAPREGPALVVSNHGSYLDPPLIGVCFPATRTPTFFARAGLFSNPVFGWLLRTVNAIPVREEGSDLSGIRDVLARLERGEVVVLFPEGSRSSDGALQPLKRGVGLLVKRAKCPVTPCAIDGAFEAWPRSRTLPRLFARSVGVEFGPAISHEELMRDGVEGAVERVESAIREIHGRLRARRGG